MADRPTILADYTTSVGELTKAVQRIFAQPGAGMVFQDAIADAVKGLQKHDNPRRAIVVITTEGTDFSNVPYQRTLEMLHGERRQLPRAGDHRPRPAPAIRDQQARERAHRDRRGHALDRRAARGPALEHGAGDALDQRRRRPDAAIQGGVRASRLAGAAQEDSTSA